MSFNPDRFLSHIGPSEECDPRKLVFGFGRRVCPGRFLAQSTIYLAIAKTLAVFKISKAGKTGQEANPVIDFQPGIISQPIPYEVRVEARDAESKRLIRDIQSQHPWTKGDSGKLGNICREFVEHAPASRSGPGLRLYLSSLL